MKKHVTIEVKEVGQKFGCKAIIRDGKTRKKLAETRLYPYGFSGAAIDGARAIIKDHASWADADSGQDGLGEGS
jgi:hypothetical protein